MLDLVGFSEVTVAEQIAAKSALTRVLRHALAFLPDEDYRLIDTGDGAAVGFTSDPEYPLYAALAIDAAWDGAGAAGGARALRLGINLGPVQEQFDVNGRTTLIGDGINSAQRIMSFAEPGHILLSRSFCDSISRIAPEYLDRFEPLGTRADKHGRDHELFALRDAPGLFRALSARIADAGPAPLPRVIDVPAREAIVAPAPARPAIDAHAALPAAVPVPAPPRGGRRLRLPVVAALLLLCGVGGVLAWRGVARVGDAPAAATVPPPAAVKDVAAPATTEARRSPPPAPTPLPAAPLATDATAAPAAPAQPAATAVPATGPAAAPAPVAKSTAPAAAPRREAAPGGNANPPPGGSGNPVSSGTGSPAPGSRTKERAARCAVLLQKQSVGESLSADDRAELLRVCD